jgi:hypothetical protein
MQGGDIVLLPDNDPAGREHVELIAQSLASIARRLRILELPNLPEKGDVVDWHAAGGTAEEFARLVEAAPRYVPDESGGPQPLMRPLPPPETFPLEALRIPFAATSRVHSGSSSVNRRQRRLTSSPASVARRSRRPALPR